MHKLSILTQLMYRLGLFKPFERMKFKSPNICDFVKILKTECNLQYFTRNCRNKNLYDFEIDEADANLWRAGLLNVKEKGMTR